MSWVASSTQKLRPEFNLFFYKENYVLYSFFLSYERKNNVSYSFLSNIIVMHRLVYIITIRTLTVLLPFE